jgi:peptidoglycan hydrolase-like protein with peptidoglycan-binding domain
VTAETQATITGIRQEMVTNCNWGVAHNADIHYPPHDLNARPIPINIPKYHLPFTTDCSGFVTIMAKWSGAPDPNGLGYDGQGYTGTLLQHLPHITKQDSLPGDLVVFGPPPGDHVVVLVEPGTVADPQVVSHGGESDPSRSPLSGMISWFGQHGHPGVTYLRLPTSGPPPPPPPPDHNPFIPLAVDGSFGPLTTKALQWRLGVATDGIFGPLTKLALQRHLGVTPDGDIGPVTIKALQRRVGVSQDGIWGPQTTEGLQRSLNANTF